MEHLKGRDWFRGKLEDFTPPQLQEIISDIPDNEIKQKLAKLLAKRQITELRDSLADYQADWEENNPVMYA